MGEGAEYFRIWIVNVALTIATLGVYSAWAKVRRNQYFYRNTRLAGASFDYHGEPVAILKGRIVGAVLFGAYTAAGTINPVLAVVIFGLIAVAMPWLLSRSLRFRLHNSSYRGLRFRFTGSTRSAYWIFLGLPALVVLSFFTAAPFWHQRFKAYQFNHAAYAQTPFRLDAPVSSFYFIYLTAACIALLVPIAVVGAAATMAAAAMLGGAAAGFEAESPEGSAAASVFAFGFVIILAVIYLLGVLTIQAFTLARIRNLLWANTTLGQHRFKSEVRTRPLLWLTLTNLLATLMSAGLFWPFAQVRLARYLTSTFVLEPGGSLDAFTAEPSSDVNAVGEEVAEMFDFDIAF
jgi:uncharacterized membrane protein YjgN (DUF898 family)